jgi:hypothetical protein
MCLILAIVEVDFSSKDSEETVYGDQGQEVAWKVGEKHVVAEQEVRGEEQEIDARSVSGERVGQRAQRERAFEQQHQAERGRDRNGS